MIFRCLTDGTRRRGKVLRLQNARRVVSAFNDVWIMQPALQRTERKTERRSSIQLTRCRYTSFFLPFFVSHHVVRLKNRPNKNTTLMSSAVPFVIRWLDDPVVGRLCWPGGRKIDRTNSVDYIRRSSNKRLERVGHFLLLFDGWNFSVDYEIMFDCFSRMNVCWLAANNTAGLTLATWTRELCVEASHVMRWLSSRVSRPDVS